MDQTVRPRGDCVSRILFSANVNNRSKVSFVSCFHEADSVLTVSFERALARP